MSHYRVTFFKKVLSADGHQFKCPQQKLDIEDSMNAEQATNAAIREFESRHRSTNWRVFADSIEVETLEPT